MKTYYNTTYIGVIDLDTNEKQTTIVGLEDLDLSDWRKSFITELVEVAGNNCQDEFLDEFLAKSVAALATLLEPSFTANPKKGARQKTSKSSFGDLLLFWSYCLHRCVCVFVCVCVCVRLVAS